MTSIRYSCHKTLFLLLLLFVVRGYTTAQTNISGVINNYAKVNILGADRVEVDDATAFSAGDTVMLMQMKGVEINSGTVSFGTLQNVNGIPGHFEVLIVQSVSPPEVVFRNNVINSYDIDGGIQLVRIPGYQNATVTGTLTCEPWDSAAGTGGVLAVFVDNILELQADIDVTGKGFSGGMTDGAWIGDCVATDPVRFDVEVIHADSLISGYKGEGICNAGIPDFDESVFKGKASLYNGGGGGIGRFSGGGGGGNMGAGASGGDEAPTCTYSGSSGEGGNALNLTEIDDGIHPGGGGGSANQENIGAGSDGAAGGGVVIIMATTLIGNNHPIRANGAMVQDTALINAGAGGGGAGGSVALWIDDYSGSAVNIHASGGQGGSTNNAYGYGGGGGGGLIWHKGNSLPGGVTHDISGGDNGYINASTSSPTLPSATQGANGLVKDQLDVTLNGFLFNTIYSRNTEALKDTICEGEVHDTIMGTAAIGGTPPFNYSWEVSYDKISWNPLAGESNTYYFTAAAQTDTLYYRRTITDNSVPVITDVSKVMEMYVHPEITNNLVTYDTILCQNQQPIDFNSFSGPPAGGNGVYKYLWQQSTDLSSWADAAGVNNQESYDPPVLTDTTWYRRWVYSGKCSSLSDTIAISVLPALSNNVVSSDQVICEGSLFDSLEGATPGGGDLVNYRYEWEQSPDNNTWSPAYGTDDHQDYNPDTTASTFPGTAYYRRTVYSGEDEVCVDVSNTVSLTDWPEIYSNEISADQTICAGELPAGLNGLLPGGGNNSYTYSWQDSLSGGSWTDATGINNQESYNPPVLTDTTWLRRVVASSVCRDTSSLVSVYAHPLITGNTTLFASGLADTTLCSGGDPNRIRGGNLSGGNGIYNYQWEESTDGSSWGNAAGEAGQADYDPPALTDTLYFRRMVTSGVCVDAGPVNMVTILPGIENNTISADQTVCYNTSPLQLNGTPPSGGDGSYTYFWEQSPDHTVWSAAAGANASVAYQPPTLTETQSYKRKVVSGPNDCCVSISNTVDIDIHTLPTGAITSLQDTLCAGESGSFELTLTGASPWDISYTDGANNYDIHNQASATYNESVLPAEDMTYRLSALTDANGCVATDLTGQAEFTVYEVPVASVDAAGALDSICGLKYRLEATPSVGTGAWIHSGVPLDRQFTVAPGRDSIELSAWQTDNDTYDFYWKETNWQCKDSAALMVVFSRPPSPARAGEDIEQASYVFNALLDAEAPLVGEGLWSIPDPAGTVNFQGARTSILPAATVSGLQFGQNALLWTVSNGSCPVNKDTLYITIQDVWVPTGFSPNGDQWNQTFRIEGIDQVENELVVFDINGVEVYRQKNYDNNWAGKDSNGNNLPEGTYYYTLKVGGGYGDKYSGFVVLKR